MKKLPIRCIELPAATPRTVLRLCHALVVFVSLMLAAQAEEARFFRIVGPGATTIMEVTPDGYVTWTNELTNVTCTVQAARLLPDATSWVDYVQVPVSNHVVSQRLFDLNPPSGMALIPAGSFLMGATTNVGHESYPDEVPQHTVYVSAFYMDRTEVTKAMWDEVKGWNGGNGYNYEKAGSGKAPNHPVHTIYWYDMVKWCNARSEKEGLTPCYYTNAGLTTIYKTGRVAPAPYVKWNANGYRLPTEAEWEKAARGGTSGHRFPWSDTDTIQHSRANYDSFWYGAVPYYPYDVNATSGYHPTSNDGVYPYTTPVGYFAANGYGLYDMTGNLMEWCWDRYSGTYYSSSLGTDPRGPASGTTRVLRGSHWAFYADRARCAGRMSLGPDVGGNGCGLRCVRGL